MVAGIQIKLQNCFSQEFINDLSTVPCSGLDAFSDVEDELPIWNTLFTNVMNEHISPVT